MRILIYGFCLGWYLFGQGATTRAQIQPVTSTFIEKGSSMQAQTYPVISVANNLVAPDGVVVSSDHQRADDATAWRVTKRTLRGGLQEGVTLIDVDNGKMQFSVIASRGMSVLRVHCGDVQLGWRSPVKQIVHPQFIDLQDHGGLGWLAGFNEWMVRCGVAFAGHPGDDNERLLTLHGRIGNIPASEVEVIIDPQPPHRIRIRGLVEEKMFKFGAYELWTEVATEPGSNQLEFNDRLVNRSEYDQEFQIIYHVNYGPPLLEKDAVFLAPVRELFPFDEYAAKDLDTYQTYLPPTANYGEQVYCMRMFADDENTTTVMLHNAAGNKGVAMQYGTDSLPGFTLWKNTDTAADGYVTGLEPGTGFPYNRSVERAAGRVPKLAAGDEQQFNVKITVLENAKAVKATVEKITEIRQGRAPTVHESPPLPPVEK